MKHLLNRRDLIKSAGLTLAVASSGSLITACSSAGDPNATMTSGYFLRIDGDGKVTVISPNTELGQGAYTGLATLVAEELGVGLDQVVVEGALADLGKYGNPAFGGALQGTGGSTTINAFWEPMRKAGATARAMLAEAAAQQWKVPASEITISNGVASHAGSSKSAPIGELVEAAAKLEVPADVALKDPKDFTLIGRDVQRVDAREKSTGTALFTQDLQLPDMLVASVVYPPRFGGKVKRVDDAAAKAVAGVHSVHAFSTPVRDGVAVVASDFYTAKKGAEALKIEWDETNAFVMGTAAIFAQYKALAQKPGLEAAKKGDAAGAYAKAPRRHEAAYEFPYLSHASMEPLNCVAQLKADGCEIWNGEQMQTPDQGTVADYLGLAPEQVKINMLYAGGSFGRRGNPKADYLLDTVAIAKAEGSGRPLKLVWTRENDMQAGFYRPAYYHTLKAGFDSKGRISSWQHRIVGQSIVAGSPLDSGAAIDFTSVEGAANLPYQIENLQVELHTTNIGVPVQWWRSVGSTHTAYAVEVFLDEIARATKQDPVELRRSMLSEHPRHVAVLNLAAEKAGWGSDLPAGTARGVALHESFNSVVAQIVEVSKQDGGYKVERVVCAVDCGIAVNPNIVAMQMESSIAYGLSAAMNGTITLKDGHVEQSNFHNHPVLRMNQMPKVEVHIVPSANKPTGVGEPGTPPIGPAVANAIANFTGSPVRKLPFSSSDVTLI